MCFGRPRNAPTAATALEYQTPATARPESSPTGPQRSRQRRKHGQGHKCPSCQSQDTHCAPIASDAPMPPTALQPSQPTCIRPVLSKHASPTALIVKGAGGALVLPAGSPLREAARLRGRHSADWGKQKPPHVRPWDNRFYARSQRPIPALSDSHTASTARTFNISLLGRHCKQNVYNARGEHFSLILPLQKLRASGNRYAARQTRIVNTTICRLQTCHAHGRRW